MNRRIFIQNTALATGALFIPNYGFAIGKNKFNPSIGICASVEKSALMKSIGYSFIEENIGRFFMPDKIDADFEKSLNQLKSGSLNVIAANGFIPGTLKTTGPEIKTEELLKWANNTFRRAQQTNTQFIVFGSGGSRKIPDSFDKNTARTQFIDICKKFGVIAQKYGITIVLEPLNYGETNLLNTLEEGLDFTNEINHPNVQLLADIYHMLKNNEKPESILKAGDKLKHVHIAEKEKRTPPGIAGDDFRLFFESLKKINYKGSISLECKWQDIDKEAVIALDTMKKQLKEI